MVTLPAEFVATKYSGYFWNLIDKRLYTLKITGELRPLKYSAPNQWNYFRGGYQVSVGGQKRRLTNEYLQTLKPKAQVFPVAKV